MDAAQRNACGVCSITVMIGAVERGLCATCIHAETITSSKGSEFVLCRLSYVDTRFTRYPRLPVLVCSGYMAGTQDPSSSR